jgi:hypothetical protein
MFPRATFNGRLDRAVMIRSDRLLVGGRASMPCQAVRPFRSGFSVKNH